VSEAPAKKKDIKVHVLRCRSQACRALLPFEETDEGLLLGNMIEVASRDGDVSYFRCPRCGGRNLVEEIVYEGKKRTRVGAFAAA
jgi:DNA-directed RNA polymerase subunit RPC12/RpoP